MPATKMLWFSQNKKFIFSILAIFLIAGVVWYSYPVIRDRYFPSSEDDSQSENTSVQDTSENVSGAESAEEKATEDHSVSSEDTTDGTSSSDTTEVTGTDEETSSGDGTINIDTNERGGDDEVFASITNYHCSSECKAFANNFQYLEYCQQVCGLSDEKDVSESDCKKKDDLEKDYCYKDLAIKKLDASYCNQIDDANIFKTCKTRIMQEALEK